MTTPRSNISSKQQVTPLDARYQYLSQDHSNVRLYLTLRNVCFLGASVHILFIFFFLSIGAIYLSLINILSVSTWLFALYKNHQGRYFIATIVSAMEIVVHAVLVSLILGLSMGFHYFLWPVAALLMMSPLFSAKVSSIIGFSIIGLFGFLVVYAEHIEYSFAYEALASYVQIGNIMFAAVGFVLVTVSARSKNVKTEKQLYELANQDGLTETYNRRFVYDLVEQMQKERRRSSSLNYTAMICDIDDFKQISDQLGHLDADKVIKDVAAYIKSTVRETDLVARWGGEQFLILLMDIDAEGTVSLSEKIRKNVRYHVDLKSNTDHITTLSIGIAKARESEDFEDTLRRADISMYKAKKLGKNRIINAD